MVANAGHFSSVGMQNCVTVNISSICNSNGKSLLAIVDEQNVPQVVYQQGHVFHAIGIRNIQS